MKLIFLGDSFTEGGGKLHDELKYIYDNQKNIQDDFINFKKKQIWTFLISQELNLENDNFAQGGAGVQNLLNQFIESEYKNYKIDRFYIIGMPNLNNARLMTSKVETELNYIKHFSNNMFFNKNMTIIFNDYINNKNQSSKKEYLFFKKFFKKEYFYHINLQSFTCLLSYMKLNKIPFLFLPTWEETVEKHLIKNENNNLFLFNRENKNSELKKIYDFFFLNEIKNNITVKRNWISLSCGHPDFNSQKTIKNNYIKYIKEKINEINISR